MKYPKQIIPFILLIFFSCTEDLDLNDSYTQPQLVINSLFSPDKPITVNLSSSINLLGNTYPYIENAHITLYENDNEVSTFQYQSDGEYVTDYFPVSGKVYTIKATASGYKGIVAVDSLSINPTFWASGFNYLYPTVYLDEMTFGTLSFDLHDYSDNNQINYYEIRLSESSNFYIANDFVSIKDWEPPYPHTILFTNEKFAGKTVSISLFTTASYSSSVSIRKVSYTYYKYKTTWYVHKNNQTWERETINEFFKGEPIDMFSNVEGGYGIFASYDTEINHTLSK